MKKVFLLALFVMGATFYSETQAQNIADNALGLRLGGGDGFGAEVSYQRGLGQNNRMEFDLGWRNDSSFDAFKITALYQWVWNIDGGFNWYAGAGGGVGSVNDNRRDYDDGGAFVFLAGDIGIEYDFDIPLIISLDLRPEIGFLGDDSPVNNFSPDFALGLRYQF